MTSIDPHAHLRVDGLTKVYPHRGVAWPRKGRSTSPRMSQGDVTAVDNLEFEVKEGQAVGIVGESGCGKTTVARCLLRLIKPTSGSIFFDGQPVLSLSGSRLQAFRRQAQIVFQDPFASLDPRFTVQRALAEPLRVHKIGTHSEIPARATQLLQSVGLNHTFASRYRHELSGGEAQRVTIARALATNPRFLILDEPTSALDASARLKVISLLQELRRELGMTYLVISHDLSIIRYLCDRVLVMYLGRIVEDAPVGELFSNPQHPYTEALLSATPVARGHERVARIRLRGQIDTAMGVDGCALAPRCHHAVAECFTRPQRLEPITPTRSVACHRVSEGQIALPTHAASTGSVQQGEDRT
jgi:oligopeptide/dipeptide ABC transporter ATP-binding protein